MSRKRKIAAGVLISLVTFLVGSVFALSNVALFLGTIPQYDFGVAGPGFPVPATVQIHAFMLLRTPRERPDSQKEEAPNSC